MPRPSDTNASGRHAVRGRRQSPAEAPRSRNASRSARRQASLQPRDLPPKENRHQRRQPLQQQYLRDNPPEQQSTQQQRRPAKHNQPPPQPHEFTSSAPSRSPRQPSPKRFDTPRQQQQHPDVPLTPSRPIVGDMGGNPFRWPLIPGAATSWEYDCPLTRLNLTRYEGKYEIALLSFLDSLLSTEMTNRQSLYDIAIKRQDTIFGEFCERVATFHQHVTTTHEGANLERPTLPSLLWCPEPHCRANFLDVARRNHHVIQRHHKWLEVAVATHLDRDDHVQELNAEINEHVEVTARKRKELQEYQRTLRPTLKEVILRTEQPGSRPWPLVDTPSYTFFSRRKTLLYSRDDQQTPRTYALVYSNLTNMETPGGAAAPPPATSVPSAHLPDPFYTPTAAPSPPADLKGVLNQALQQQREELRREHEAQMEEERRQHQQQQQQERIQLEEKLRQAALTQQAQQQQLQQLEALRQQDLQKQQQQQQQQEELRQQIQQLLQHQQQQQQQHEELRQQTQQQQEERRQQAQQLEEERRQQAQQQQQQQQREHQLQQQLQAVQEQLRQQQTVPQHQPETEHQSQAQQHNSQVSPSELPSQGVSEQTEQQASQPARYESIPTPPEVTVPLSLESSVASASAAPPTVENLRPTHSDPFQVAMQTPSRGRSGVRDRRQDMKNGV